MCPHPASDHALPLRSPERSRLPVGVGFTPFETRSDVILTVARRADELGLDFVGIAEGWTYDALILLAELALQTERNRSDRW
jgi:alkanesulfonate monooxygenase SsuD/methylene tetrahydromethanopterin reductase-like flavin-dependent oxidoreductase (luciferase family)